MHELEIEELLLDFCTYCEKIETVWAKEFREWIPDYMAQRKEEE